MRYIEPVYDQYWDDDRDEFIHSDFVIGYRVVSETGAILGEGETREDALAKAQEHILMPA